LAKEVRSIIATLQMEEMSHGEAVTCTRSTSKSGVLAECRVSLVQCRSPPRSGFACSVFGLLPQALME